MKLQRLDDIDILSVYDSPFCVGRSRKHSRTYYAILMKPYSDRGYIVKEFKSEDEAFKYIDKENWKNSFIFNVASFILLGFLVLGVWQLIINT